MTESRKQFSAEKAISVITYTLCVCLVVYVSGTTYAFIAEPSEKDAIGALFFEKGRILITGYIAVGVLLYRMFKLILEALADKKRSVDSEVEQ